MARRAGPGGNLPAMLQAIVAFDAWNELSVLQHSPWLGGPYCASILRHEFKGLAKSPLNSLCFSAVSDCRCHLCALALGISQAGGQAATISALRPHFSGEVAIQRPATLRLHSGHSVVALTFRELPLVSGTGWKLR